MKLNYFLDQQYKDKTHIDLFMIDTLNAPAINEVLDGVNIVLHAAANKHVILCEKVLQPQFKIILLGFKILFCFKK